MVPEGLQVYLYLSESVYNVVVQNLIPAKNVNLSFIVTDIKNKLTDLCGSRLLPDDFMNTLCEIKVLPSNDSGLCFLFIYIYVCIYI